jgi:hypothetical protein
MPESVAVSNSNSVYDAPAGSRTVATRTGAQHPHVHVTAPHRLLATCAAVRSAAGKSRMSTIHMPLGREPSLHLAHIRHPSREVPQLRGMRNEHPPPGATTGTHPPQHAHPTVPARSAQIR